MCHVFNNLFAATFNKIESLAAAKLRHSHPHCAAAAYLNVGVFAVHHSDYFPPQFCFVEMIDCQRRLLRFRHLN